MKGALLHLTDSSLCSGLTWGGKMDDFPEQKGWDKVFDLNVKSQFYLTVA